MRVQNALTDSCHAYGYSSSIRYQSEVRKEDYRRLDGTQVSVDAPARRNPWPKCNRPNKARHRRLGLVCVCACRYVCNLLHITYPTGYTAEAGNDGKQGRIRR
ncbi:hypothetical protein LX32DRAFT_24336 [Colletotrichum zoysiae]|uniref:Uncharacterized protein n=1 Tax=Colletotrichum zoysiae TaxID=1216348 RepID=A0AAD9HRP8_9PEZI|nr:hypothetical protein LX32DRAFT_24336 [Colletotrichum zoysiae]